MWEAEPGKHVCIRHHQTHLVDSARSITMAAAPGDGSSNRHAWLLPQVMAVAVGMPGCCHPPSMSTALLCRAKTENCLAPRQGCSNRCICGHQARLVTWQFGWLAAGLVVVLVGVSSAWRAACLGEAGCLICAAAATGAKAAGTAHT